MDVIAPDPRPIAVSFLLLLHASDSHPTPVPGKYRKPLIPACTCRVSPCAGTSASDSVRPFEPFIFPFDPESTHRQICDKYPRHFTATPSVSPFPRIYVCPRARSFSSASSSVTSSEKHRVETPEKRPATCHRSGTLRPQISGTPAAHAPPISRQLSLARHRSSHATDLRPLRVPPFPQR